MLKKALDLIHGAVEKVKRSEELPVPKDSFTQSALVIGGGLSGLLASRIIAEAGFPVTIIEKSGEIGGNEKFLEIPHREYRKKLIAGVEENPNIKIYTNSEVIESSGYGGNFKIRVKTPEEVVDLKVGIIIIAVGAKEYRPEGFLYGENPGVITLYELNEKMASGDISGDVAFIQCVGSRNEEHPWCSRVCCNSAVKKAIALREKGHNVTIFYRDMTTYGKDDRYSEAREKGVKFIRFEKDQYPVVSAKNGKLEVKVTAFGKTSSEVVDTVVLSNAIIPDDENNRRLSRILGHPLDKDGFFTSSADVYPYEEAIKKITKPFELLSNCIFPVGLAHSPRSFEESFLIVQDAMGMSSILLSKKEMPPPNAMYVAEVKEGLCMGCGICVDVCPYSARSIDENKKIAVVHPYLCDSCGSCVSICPNDASFLRDQKRDQSVAVLDTLLV
ncbi:MAG: CoB--CoM heterodisulfide reductase iron-sulfur subunit A family protein, partial [Candidatus Eremiobacteraeota bacterium]|nr:CoB--CoM heterodisulfide reductase iron-sulfur subunit A family protein [Candidatus Eremiobacteraeota bacterium]